MSMSAYSSSISCRPTMDKSTVLRIARPTDNLEKIVQMYCDGLGFEVLGSFKGHQGFDGAMLGLKSHGYHLEFTHCHDHSAGAAPSPDNLLVFYIPDQEQWNQRCEAMGEAGFTRVDSFNPYWDRAGNTYEDIDGYRVVIAKQESPV